MQTVLVWKTKDGPCLHLLEEQSNCMRIGNVFHLVPYEVVCMR